MTPPAFDEPADDSLLPDSMLAQPGEGDIAEAFAAVLTDPDPEGVMPAPVDEAVDLGAIDEQHRQMRRELGDFPDPDTSDLLDGGIL